MYVYIIYASDSMIKLICSKASNLQRKMKVGQIGAFFLDNSKSFYLLPIFLGTSVGIYQANFAPAS